MKIPLSELTPAHIEERLLKFAEKASQSAQAYIKAQALYDSMEDRKNDHLFILMNKIEIGSEALKERMVRSSQEWEEFKSGLLIAKEDALKWKMAYQHDVRMWETYRSLLSSRNQERRTSAYGGGP